MNRMRHLSVFEKLPWKLKILLQFKRLSIYSLPHTYPVYCFKFYDFLDPRDFVGESLSWDFQCARVVLLCFGADLTGLPITGWVRKQAWFFMSSSEEPWLWPVRGVQRSIKSSPFPVICGCSQLGAAWVWAKGLSFLLVPWPTGQSQKLPGCALWDWTVSPWPSHFLLSRAEGDGAAMASSG